MSFSRFVPLLLAATLLVAGCTAPPEPDNPGGVVVSDEGNTSGYAGTKLDAPYEVPDAVFTDASGQSYNLRTSPSKPVTLIFFGYTNCPDVCIGVLSDMAMALKRTDPQVRDQITVVFVTTDPARDKPEVIKDYLDRFDPSFVGLTSDLDTIKGAASRLGVGVEGMKKLPSGGYEVGHGAQVVGVDSSDRGVVVWTPGTPVGDLKADYTKLVADA
ncbi:SCO family protein [Propionibacteriaceae bacterium Y1700]|uniref:SCO family protein n=1 Tax=Microlunatus sp. Y1700 TaxID=3418487 RepID=UPI003DA79D71